MLSGCHGLGNLLEEALKERPPAPLDSMTVASDARIDSLGVLAGSFVGEGTGRAVHLLSSDTTFIAELARRYRPDLLQGEGIWQELAMRRTVSAERGDPPAQGGQRPSGNPPGPGRLTAGAYRRHG